MLKFLIFLLVLLSLLYLTDRLLEDDQPQEEDDWARLVSEAELHRVPAPRPLPLTGETQRRLACHFYSPDCFNVYRCGSVQAQLKVYIYPPRSYVREDGKGVLEMSEEWFQMLSAVYHSDYYTPDPQAACLLLPSLDLLNIQEADLGLVASILSSLPHWDGGRNHLLFNIINGANIPSGRAILARPEYSRQRLGYHLTIPVLSNIKFTEDQPQPFLLSYQADTDTKTVSVLRRSSSELLAVPQRVEQYRAVLGRAVFCLVRLTGEIPHKPLSLLTDCLAARSIPVILAYSLTSLPFSQIIDWTEISITFTPTSLSTITATLESLASSEVAAMVERGSSVYRRHLSSPAQVVLTSLAVVERTQLVSPHQTSYPALAPPNSGFTALILTYNRVPSLFQVITKLSQVESLVRIVVVWNHQTVPPPPVEDWPRINKPLKVIQTSANKLSNRFYPYQEIETECVLSIDDDISMLTTDEFEFGYQVWREFPDTIVGFPQRTHTYDNSSGQYKYDSEWKNDISMILTGVAFYHKYWHYLYTASPSEEQRRIKDWVDEHINCEDIAFNLMVANATGKAPMKVGPRKKFKCSTPSCENAGMLSASASHLEERSHCLDKFVKIYGHNPLRQVEFRADPVLYKEDFPDTIKLYKDIGSL